MTGREPWHDVARSSVARVRFHERSKPLPRPSGMPDSVWNFVQLCIRDDALDRITSGRALAVVQEFVDSEIDWPLKL